MAGSGTIRKSICDIAEVMYRKGLTDACGGSISVRDQSTIYMTRRRSGENHQWRIEEDSIVTLDLCKRPVTGSLEAISREVRRRARGSNGKKKADRVADTGG